MLTSSFESASPAPIVLGWADMCDDSQVFGLWRTYNVQRAISFTPAQHQATVSSHILGIVLDQHTIKDNGPNLFG